MTVFQRSSGVQLHITSLPSHTLGADAYRFVDWLADAGQSWWQILPLGPPDRHGSPYNACSAFAASPSLIANRRAPVSSAEISALREREAFWLEDWAELAGPGALEDQVRFSREWGALRRYAADRGVRIYGDVAIYVAAGSADQRAHPALFLQGVQAGAPPDRYSASGQLWGNPLYNWPGLRRTGYRWWVERLRRTLSLVDLARLDHFRGFVAFWEVPDGARSAAGGHWRRGPGRALFDALKSELGPRADGRGAAAAGSLGRADGRGAAAADSLGRADGRSAAADSLGRGGGQGDGRGGGGLGLPLVAEDLGVITPAVERLRDQLELPGMLVLEFGFDPHDPHSPHRFENHREQRVVYTGTHDHDTARGWYESLDARRRAAVDSLLHAQAIDQAQPWLGMVALTLRSRARVAIIQAQDLLGLGSEARMNAPGRAGRNWQWALERLPSRRDGAWLRELTEVAGRLPPGASELRPHESAAPA